MPWQNTNRCEYIARETNVPYASVIHLVISSPEILLRSPSKAADKLKSIAMMLGMSHMDALQLATDKPEIMRDQDIGKLSRLRNKIVKEIVED